MYTHICINTILCRHTPLLVHFLPWDNQGAKRKLSVNNDNNNNDNNNDNDNMFSIGSTSITGIQVYALTCALLRMLPNGAVFLPDEARPELVL